MKVIITGVAGFIGSKVAERFVALGHEVIGIDDLSTGKIKMVPKNLVFKKGDLTRSEVYKLLPARCDLVLHLAGQSSGQISFEDPTKDLAKNTISTLNLIRYAINAGAEKIIYASSMSVYGEVEDKPIGENDACKPISCYGVGKLSSEHYLRIYSDKLPYLAMRMFNVYGPGQDMENMKQGMVSIFLSQAIKSNTVVVKGSLDRFRDFIYIDDVVDAWYEAAMNENLTNMEINVGTGIRTTIKELLECIVRFCPGTKFYTDGSTPGDQTGIYADVERLKYKLGKRSFKSLDEGLKAFVEAVK